MSTAFARLDGGEGVGQPEAVGAPRLRRMTPLPPEIQLMRRLLPGPQSLREGPVGRCTKRGWIRVVGDAAAAVRFELTEAGRRAIDPEQRDGPGPAA